MRFPNLFIAGAPKCGTTSLARYLGQHSEVFEPALKEPMFFGSDIVVSTPRLQEAEYGDVFEAWTSQPYALDATPAYLVSETAAAEIRSRVPDARVLICVRNPIDAVASSFHHNRFRQTEELSTLDEALDAEPARAAACAPPKFGALQSLLYQRVYSYAQTIPRFLAEVGSDRVMIVLLEDMQSDPAGIMAMIGDWLDIDPDEFADMDFTPQNVAVAARSKAIARLAIHPPRWLGTITRPLFARETRVRVRNVLRKLNSRPEPSPDISPETRKRLAERFMPDVEWLSGHLDRDLSHWLSYDG